MHPGLQLGIEGANNAAQHADRVSDGSFTVKAAAAFRAYAMTHAEFTAEDVRLSSVDDVPTAPDARAWGAVARAAVRAGVVKSNGIGRAKSPGCHGTWVTVYSSLVYGLSEKWSAQ